MATASSVNRVRIAIRDGATVRIKRCARCGEDKVVSDDKTSAFSVNTRRRDGSPKSWRPLCKPCDAEAARDRYRSDPAFRERSAMRKRQTYARRVVDPEWKRRRRTYDRDRQRRYRRDPAFRARQAKRQRVWRAKKMREDPEYFRGYSRMAYRLRRERDGRSVRRSSRGIDRSRPLVPAAPFAAWLRAYAEQLGLRENSAAFAVLVGANPRRVRSVLRAEQRNVLLDIVDAALIKADATVRVGGATVYRLADLYPELAT